MYDLTGLCKNAKASLTSLLNATEQTVNATLIRVAELLLQNKEYLKRENAEDIKNAEAAGKSAGFIDRLLLSDKVIEGVAEGIKKVAELKSPVGDTVYSYKNRIQDIDIKEIYVPFGVVGMIYEARPNVTADAFSLCFKTRNAVILKGGSDALNSNRAIVSLIRTALKENGIDENACSLIEDTSRETTAAFMKMNKYVDLLIPRGSASLINAALSASTIPIIETGTGNCHIFVDESADIAEAAKIIFNAKTQRYSVCNACESLVIHSAVLNKALPEIAAKLAEKQVEIRCDERALKVLPSAVPATEEDFYTEYGGAVISVKTVDSLKEAIEFINEHSTRHSESILTRNKENADRFLKEIDSACVLVNASTRFTDGFVFGLGAEIGISTQKLHARGPMGLNALLTTKFLVEGNDSVRK